MFKVTKATKVFDMKRERERLLRPDQTQVQVLVCTIKWTDRENVPY